MLRLCWPWTSSSTQILSLFVDEFEENGLPVGNSDQSRVGHFHRRLFRLIDHAVVRLDRWPVSFGNSAE